MTHRNASGCGQILAACALVVAGALGGCAVGDAAGFEFIRSDLLLWIGTVVGLAIGAVLAALVLRRSDG